MGSHSREDFPLILRSDIYLAHKTYSSRTDLFSNYLCLFIYVHTVNISLLEMVLVHLETELERTWGCT
jgi:hypothetical protein